MKQSLTLRFAALLVSVAITAVLFESVAQLGYPAPNGQIDVAETSVSATPR